MKMCSLSLCSDMGLGLSRLDTYLRQQGICPMEVLLSYDSQLAMQWLARYIQFCWNAGALGLSNIGNLLSGAKRLMTRLATTSCLRAGWT